MELFSRFLTPILGFFVTLAFGFWLSRRGKPYNGLLFNIHKLVALGAVILAVMGIYRILKVSVVELFVIVFLVIAAVSVVALFLSGAFMSAGKGEYRAMKLIHNISPFILVFSVVFVAYLV